MRSTFDEAARRRDSTGRFAATPGAAVPAVAREQLRTAAQVEADTASVEVADEFSFGRAVPARYPGRCTASGVRYAVGQMIRRGPNGWEIAPGNAAAPTVSPDDRLLREARVSAADEEAFRARGVQSADDIVTLTRHGRGMVFLDEYARRGVPATAAGGYLRDLLTPAAIDRFEGAGETDRQRMRVLSRHGINPDWLPAYRDAGFDATQAARASRSNLGPDDIAALRASGTVDPEDMLTIQERASAWGRPSGHTAAWLHSWQTVDVVDIDRITRCEEAGIDPLTYRAFGCLGVNDIDEIARYRRAGLRRESIEAYTAGGESDLSVMAALASRRVDHHVYRAWRREGAPDGRAMLDRLDAHRGEIPSAVAAAAGYASRSGRYHGD